MTENLHLLMPELFLAMLAVVVLVADLFLPDDRKIYLPWLAVLGLIGLIVLSLNLLWNTDLMLYGGLISLDNFSLFFKCVFLVLGIIVILASMDFVSRWLRSPGEYYSIVLFSILGMILMVEAQELLTAYIAIELMAFGFYVLVAFGRNNRKSNEAGLKYILVGAFSSAIFLYGLSLVYAYTAVTHFDAIEASLSSVLANTDQIGPSLWVGMALMLAGLGFKVAAVPFHMWAPDTYEGAPIPVTAFLSVGSKIASLAFMLRLFSEAFLPAIDQWQIIVAVISALTMTVGNVVAMVQSNYKRLLAYSSIGHVGFMLMGIAALSSIAIDGLLLYMIGYAVTTMAVFTALTAFFNMTGREDISDLGGLADTHSYFAAAIAVALFSLAGLPFFAGFTMKFYLFAAVGTEGFLWLAGLAIFNSFISLYYYLKMIREMYVKPTPDSVRLVMSQSGVSNGISKPTKLITCLSVVLTLSIIYLGVYPLHLLKAIQAATLSIW